MSDLVGTDQDADADDTIASNRDEDEDGDRDEDEDGQDKGDGGESETSDEDNDTDFQPENEEYEDEDAIDAEILNIDLLEDDDPRGKKNRVKKESLVLLVLIAEADAEISGRHFQKILALMDKEEKQNYPNLVT